MYYLITTANDETTVTVRAMGVSVTTSEALRLTAMAVSRGAVAAFVVEDMRVGLTPAYVCCTIDEDVYPQEEAPDMLERAAAYALGKHLGAEATLRTLHHTGAESLRGHLNNALQLLRVLRMNRLNTDATAAASGIEDRITTALALLNNA